MSRQSLNWTKPAVRILLLLLFVVIFAGVPHAYNMFEYPYYENDEGTYMAQAWSTLTTGELAPYTYWYDHAPVGWMTLGLWATMTNGFDTFGFSINSGRMLMLVTHVLTSLLLLGISKKTLQSYWPGIIAVLIFSFSPLGLYFQRRVLLDNLMVFWLFLSLYLVLGERRQLVHYAGSAIALALAFLSKESAVYFMPVVGLIVLARTVRQPNKFGLFLWGMLVVMVVSYYPLYALLKGELFPTGHPLGGTHPHVSLLETATYQATRGGGFFLDHNSGFLLNLRGWAGDFGLYADPALIMTGITATVVASLLAIFKPSLRPITLFTLVYWAFLARGGVVIEFYVVPLIPLLAMCIGAVVYLLAQFLRDLLPQHPVRHLVFSATVLLCAAPFVGEYMQHQAIYTRNQTFDQVRAVDYIVENVPHDSFVLIDMYAYMELTPIIEKAHYYWKADRDPEITVDVLQNDWCNIDYLLVTPQMSYDAKRVGLELTHQAYQNSTIMTSYSGSGWDIEIREVDKTQCNTRVESPTTVAQNSD